MISLAVILAVRFLNGTPLENQPQASEPAPTDNPSDISSTPLPNESGVTPDEPSQSENGEQGSFDPNEDPSEDSSQDSIQEPSPEDEPEDEPEDGFESGQTQENPPSRQTAAGSASLNRSLGTMTFSFSSTGQDSLDADTIAMLGNFLDSPRNTEASQIVVEIPQLSGNGTSNIKSAIIDAFAQMDVSQSNLDFITYRSSSADGSFDVRLSYSYPSNRK